jgi:uncharacterized protein YodC (DUF2158 family)
MDFKIGDTAELKSGGPTMTVSSTQTNGDMWSIWFNGTGNVYETKGAAFKPETLKRV